MTDTSHTTRDRGGVVGHIAEPESDPRSQHLVRHTSGQRVFILIKGTLTDEEMRTLKLNMAMLRVNHQVCARIGLQTAEDSTTGSAS